ncbi:MAG: RluA family pseudouridine synthase, partial [Deltaproteobacteria bacterium]|nr:RluA family pseudouridine synthase [Deltaproteobacteria bacterium]
MRRLREVAAFDGRLDTVLAATFADLSRARAASLVKGGCVAVGERTTTRPATRVAAGEVLTVELPDPVPATSTPQALPLDIVYQDGALVVVDKRAGMVVHPSAGHPDGTLVNALLHHVKDLSGIGGVERPGIVHRLDRGTSGLLVVAKTDAAHASLAAQFAAKTTGRRYLALCLGNPAEDAGTLRSFLGRHPRDRLRWASTDGTWGKAAITHWQVLARAGTVCLLACRLETGRTHQVRVHLTEAGWPLLGDPVYKRRGRRAPATLREFLAAHPERPLLHAWRLAFDHPDT